MNDYPELPPELKIDVEESQLNELWTELLKEVTAPAWINRKHNNRRTYDAGCGGPMCRKAVREYARRRNSTNPSSRYAQIDEILEYWFPHATELVEWTKRNLLSNLGK